MLASRSLYLAFVILLFGSALAHPYEYPALYPRFRRYRHKKTPQELQAHKEFMTGPPLLPQVKGFKTTERSTVSKPEVDRNPAGPTLRPGGPLVVGSMTGTPMADEPESYL